MQRALITALAATPLAIATPAWADAGLTVAFPPSGYQTSADRIFFIGTASPGTPVTINGASLDRSPAGHFAPSFSLKPGDNVFRVVAGGQVMVIHVTRVAAAPAAPTGLAFGAGSLQPAADTMRLPGERVSFSAIAPAGASVTVLWGGKRIPLAAQPPGYTLPENKAGLIFQNQPRPRTDGIRYEGAVVLGAPAAPASPVFELTLNGRMLRQVGPGKLGALDPAALAVVQVGTDEGVARTGPSSDYSRVTPLPRGTRAAVTGSDGPWLRLSSNRWIRASETSPLPGASTPFTLVKSLRTRQVPGWTEIVIPLETPVPLDVEEAPHRFSFTLNGATAQTDIILENDDPLLERLDFAQVAPDQIRYTAWLKPDQAWGYKTRYEGSTLVVSLRQPPVLDPYKSPLAGRKIVLDPGHGGADDPGTTGPTGLHEKDLTLPVARLVRDELVRRGAQVTLTRDDDQFVDLPVRTGLIRKLEPDLALSLHYNALPDGGDARNTRGIGAFWFDPLSHTLARALHKDLTNGLARPSYGLFWDNLALTRPTVCPAVLLEIGFLTNPEDFEWLTDPAAQRKLAGAIADSLEGWFRQPY